MPEPDLQLAPPIDGNRLIPKLIIAGMVMTVIGAAVYLLSDLARGVSGHILFVDSGFNIVAM